MQGTKLKKFIAMAIATFAGVGFLPKMPGTWGSLAALPFAWYLWQAPQGIAFTVLVLGGVLAVWASHHYEQCTGKHDNQSIVVDEVMGMLVTTIFAQHSFLQYGLAFLLFRLFDVWKPFPVRYLDRKVSGGFGVVLDDVAAGIYAMLILALYNYWRG